MFFKKIDSLPKGSEWMCEIFEIKGDHKDENGDAIIEEVELWKQNPVECVREPIGNPAFKDGMRYSPEKHYEDESWTAECMMRWRQVIGGGRFRRVPTFKRSLV